MIGLWLTVSPCAIVDDSNLGTCGRHGERASEEGKKVWKVTREG